MKDKRIRSYFTIMSIAGDIIGEPDVRKNTKRLTETLGYIGVTSAASEGSDSRRWRILMESFFGRAASNVRSSMVLAWDMVRLGPKLYMDMVGALGQPWSGLIHSTVFCTIGESIAYLIMTR